jgi:hypothetical protein
MIDPFFETRKWYLKGGVLTVHLDEGIMFRFVYINGARGDPACECMSSRKRSKFTCVHSQKE